jgi:succinate dehydrogenase hydrophobic anchor subunit
VIRKCMPLYLSNAFGSIILIAIGLWVIAEDYLKRRGIKRRIHIKKRSGLNIWIYWSTRRMRIRTNPEPST